MFYLPLSVCLIVSDNISVTLKVNYLQLTTRRQQYAEFDGVVMFSKNRSTKWWISKHIIVHCLSLLQCHYSSRCNMRCKNYYVCIQWRSYTFFKLHKNRPLFSRNIWFDANRLDSSLK